MNAQYKVRQMYPLADVVGYPVEGLPSGNVYCVVCEGKLLSALCGDEEMAWTDAAGRL